MITLNAAFELLTAVSNLPSWREPSIVRFESLMAFRQAGDTGAASDGAIGVKALRTSCGAVGAKSGLLVIGLLHVLIVGLPAFALRNERSSRKNSSRFLPQRN